MTKKITKSFRLDSDTVNTLEQLVTFYYEKLDLFNGKKVTATDLVDLLIQKEKESLKDKGYTL